MEAAVVVATLDFEDTRNVEDLIFFRGLAMVSDKSVGGAHGSGCDTSGTDCDAFACSTFTVVAVFAFVSGGATAVIVLLTTGSTTSTFSSVVGMAGRRGRTTTKLNARTYSRYV